MEEGILSCLWLHMREKYTFTKLNHWILGLLQQPGLTWQIHLLYLDSGVNTRGKRKYQGLVSRNFYSNWQLQLQLSLNIQGHESSELNEWCEQMRVWEFRGRKDSWSCLAPWGWANNCRIHIREGRGGFEELALEKSAGFKEAEGEERQIGWQVEQAER